MVQICAIKRVKISIFVDWTKTTKKIANNKTKNI